MKKVKNWLISVFAFMLVCCMGVVMSNGNQTLTANASTTATILSAGGGYQTTNGGRFLVNVTLDDASQIALTTGHAVTVKVNGEEHSVWAHRFNEDNTVSIIISAEIAKTDRSNVIEIPAGATINGVAISNSHFITTNGTTLHANASPLNVSFASGGAQDNLSRYLITLQTDSATDVANNAWNNNVALLDGAETAVNYSPSGTNYLCIVPYSAFGSDVTSAAQITEKHTLVIPAFTAIGDHYTLEEIVFDMQGYNVTAPVRTHKVAVTGLGSSARQANRWFFHFNLDKEIEGSGYSANYGKMKVDVNGVEVGEIWINSPGASQFAFALSFEQLSEDATARITIPAQLSTGGTAGVLEFTNEYSIVVSNGAISEDVAHVLTLGATTKQLKLFEKIGELPEVPAREHYENGRWIVDGEQITADTEFVYIQDKTAQLFYDAVSYTVTFMAEGEEVAVESYTIENTEITVPAVPAKEHYEGAWVEYSLDGGNKTVNAVYTPTQYTVTFMAEGEEVAVESYTVENTEISVPAVPAKEHYEGAWVEYALDGGNKTVNAVYTPTQYTVTFMAEGEEVAVERYTVENTEITVPTVPSKEGFDGEWEAYELNGGNKVVNAVYTEKEPESEDESQPESVVESESTPEESANESTVESQPESTSNTESKKESGGCAGSIGGGLGFLTAMGLFAVAIIRKRQ